MSMGDKPDADDDEPKKVKVSITLPKDEANQLIENSPGALNYQDGCGRRSQRNSR